MCCIFVTQLLYPLDIPNYIAHSTDPDQYNLPLQIIMQQRECNLYPVLQYMTNLIQQYHQLIWRTIQSYILPDVSHEGLQSLFSIKVRVKLSKHNTMALIASCNSQEFCNIIDFLACTIQHYHWQCDLKYHEPSEIYFLKIQMLGSVMSLVNPDLVFSPILHFEMTAHYYENFWSLNYFILQKPCFTFKEMALRCIISFISFKLKPKP